MVRSTFVPSEMVFSLDSLVPVADDHIFHQHVLIHGVDAHFRLNLKALGDHGETLDEGIAEGPVAGHDVLDICVEDHIDHFPHQTVAEVVEGTLVFRKVG